ncbi:hypothetical protein [Mycolicibacterium wolinskyi]|uniref:hypothetical protein n=1 Tax=Mycolicibacterium wolinskyi TaxID=59750 RepID=UPI003917B1E5
MSDPPPAEELEEREAAAREIHICMYHMTIEDIRLLMTIARYMKTQRLENT